MTAERTRNPRDLVQTVFAALVRAGYRTTAEIFGGLARLLREWELRCTFRPLNAAVSSHSRRPDQSISGAGVGVGVGLGVGVDVGSGSGTVTVVGELVTVFPSGSDTWICQRYFVPGVSPDSV